MEISQAQRWVKLVCARHTSGPPKDDPVLPLKTEREWWSTPLAIYVRAQCKESRNASIKMLLAPPPKFRARASRGPSALTFFQPLTTEIMCFWIREQRCYNNYIKSNCELKVRVFSDMATYIGVKGLLISLETPRLTGNALQEA